MAYDPTGLNLIKNLRATSLCENYLYEYNTDSDTIADVEQGSTGGIGSSYFVDDGHMRIADLLQVTAVDGRALYFVISRDPTYGIGLDKLAIVVSFLSSA